MQISNLGHKGSHAADAAYGEVLERDAEDHRWLLEVGTIARPRVGRIRVGMTFPDGETTTLHENDLVRSSADLGGLTGYYVSTLTGPLGAMFAAALAESEQSLLHVGDLKNALPRDSSALVLVAERDACDALVRMFDSYSPEIIRSEVEPELRARLEALERRVHQAVPAESVPRGL